jgi:hypothetical protein
LRRKAISVPPMSGAPGRRLRGASEAKPQPHRLGTLPFLPPNGQGPFGRHRLFLFHRSGGGFSFGKTKENGGCIPPQSRVLREIRKSPSGRI